MQLKPIYSRWCYVIYTTLFTQFNSITDSNKDLKLVDIYNGKINTYRDIAWRFFTS